MYAKGKGSTVPSDAQAREKLALYVYEYLLHVGAQKAAQTFLSEVSFSFASCFFLISNLTTMFLSLRSDGRRISHSVNHQAFCIRGGGKWLRSEIFTGQLITFENNPISVFWDLYCAAPERRDTCEHSSEAKAFHDYGFVSSGYGVNGIAHNSGPAPSPLGQLPSNEGIPGGPMAPGFFPVRLIEKYSKYILF